MKTRQILDLFTIPLVIVMAGLFLWHFMMIMSHPGGWTISESNPLILYSEIGLFIGITGFGIYRLYYFCRYK